MKNQMDMILSGVAILIAIVVAFFFSGTARKPVPKPPVEKINVAPVSLPVTEIPMSAGIGASAAGGGGGGGSSGGGGGRRRGGG